MWDDEVKTDKKSFLMEINLVAYPFYTFNLSFFPPKSTDLNPA